MKCKYRKYCEKYKDNETEQLEICKTCNIVAKFMKSVNFVLLNIWK